MLKTTLFLISLTCQLIFYSTSYAKTYYVSPSGSDHNTGSSEREAFQTVQYAIDQMQAKDQVIIGDGIYTGTLKLKSDISLNAKNPRKVIFSGAEFLKGEFEKHSDNIYKIKVDKEIKQIFYKNKPMTWARWPNLKWSENWIGAKKWKASSKGSGPGVLKCSSFKELKDLDLIGAYCFLRYSKGNSCYSRLIESFDSTTLEWDDTDFYSVSFTGEDGRRGSPHAIAKGKAKAEVRAKFFLAGAIDLIDSEGEWAIKDNTLYFYAPGGIKPNASELMIKTNDYSIFSPEALSNVSFSGIDFFATSVKLGNQANNKIIFKDSQFSYIGAELLFINNIHGRSINRPIHVNGTYILFDKCLFSGAQNSALQLSGSKIMVRNCVFLEINRHGNFGSRPLVMHAKGTYKITRNTFFNNCSDAILISFSDDYEASSNPHVSYNNIFNAGIFNSDVSGVYMPNLSQHHTEFHHNWVHNVKGNGVRLDQAGEKLNVHHNVFWGSKRGMNIEGFGNFNIYNNTSVYNKEPCAMTRNVLDKRKGTGDAFVSNDTSFPPITDWNIVNNLVTHFVDRVGPSEDGALQNSKTKGTLHPERAKSRTLRIKDRDSIQGNLTGFKNAIFTKPHKENLNLIPVDTIIENGVVQTDELKAQGLTGLDSFRGAYAVGDKGWPTGSTWMPYGFDVLKTMAQSENFAKKYKLISIIPRVNINSLSFGQLSPKSYEAPFAPKTKATKKKAKRKNKK